MSDLAMPSLVLNRNWTPIRVITAADAFSLLFGGKAKAVDADYSVYDFDSWTELRAKENEPYVTTGRFSRLKIPDVIVLLTYGAIPEQKLAFSRANIYRRDKYTCQFCGERPAIEDLTIDHITPKSRGGISSWENCVIACWDCNSKKGARTLKECGLTLLKKPTKPTWSPALVLARVKNTPKNWEKFVNNAYWNCKLKE
jgi:5-methylcytosine-specific restriction endonuclease McrA